MEERQEEFSAAKKGTITHFVMQHIDLDKVTYIDEIREEVLKMVKKELLTEEEGKVVNVFKIQKFFKSDLGQRMLNSYKSGKKVYSCPLSFFINTVSLFNRGEATLR